MLTPENNSTNSKAVRVGTATFDNRKRFCLIAGPCALESRQQGLEIATELAALCAARDIGYVFKASFDKANRTSAGGARGIGLTSALAVFAEIQQSLGLPTTTDVHEPDQCHSVAEVVSMLQIPALLSRQTDLLMAAGAAAQSRARAVNIKKGQFMAPADIHHAADKVRSAGCDAVLLTERGVTFGYNTLVNDMRALPIMASKGDPVIFDATHSVQRPSAGAGKSDGERQYVAALARAAVAVGVAGIFIETHPDPDRAASDGPNMIPLAQMGRLLDELVSIDTVVKA